MDRVVALSGAIRRRPVSDWDDAYANRAHVPETDAIVAGWRADAPAFRKSLGSRADLDRRYGPGARHVYDLFRPRGAARGLFVFLHGGYWMSFDKSTWSHLAAGAVARGWAAAVPSYTLAPEARIAAITREAVQAISAAAREVEGPVVVAGHSAGGQLATRAVCRDVEMDPELRARIRRVVSISGVHDLRPLLHTRMNETLRLTPEEARAESPALGEPVAGLRLTAWVGAAERPEFVRQNSLLANVWAGLGVEATQVEEAGRHHFDVIAGLAEAESPLVEAALGEDE